MPLGTSSSSICLIIHNLAVSLKTKRNREIFNFSFKYCEKSLKINLDRYIFVNFPPIFFGSSLDRRVVYISLFSMKLMLFTNLVVSILCELIRNTYASPKVVAVVLFFSYRKLEKISFFYTKIQRLLLYFSMLFDHYSSNIIVIKF